jgi:hypothetical protein
MLLGDRRQALMHFSLVGMEMAWITPFVTLLLHQHGLGWTPGVTYCRLLAAVLLWILALELLNRRQWGSPGYQFVVVVLLLLSTMAIVRLWLHGDLPLSDWSWLRATLDALFNFHQGLQAELILILTNLFLWQRATSATSRSLDFFNVGLSFRFGILLLILGGGLLMHVTGYDATFLFWLHMGLGLVAVSLARIRDKASSGGSVGKPMPGSRVAQLLAAVAFTMAGVAGLSFVYTPTSLKTAVGWLAPVWRLLGVLGKPLGEVVLWLIEVIVNGLYWLFSHLMVGRNLEILDELRERLTGLLAGAERTDMSVVTLPPWLLTALRYGGVLVTLLILVSIVLLSLKRIREQQRREETEEELEEEITLGGDTLGRGWRWLRDRVGLVRRFGVGRELLAAISVQNMYANLCRLAGQRGYPRHPAQPPDRYLPHLVQAFGGHQEAISRLTMAYMRVHYGDRAVGIRELASLRRDYDQVRTAEQETDA